MIRTQSITAQSISTDDIKRHNLARVLRFLHENGELSRSELVSRTGLNRSTIGALVSDLALAGIVEEGPGSGGTVGRPSLVVRPTPTSAFVVAFDLRVDRIVGAAFSLGGQVLAQVERPRADGPFAPHKAVSSLVECTEELFAGIPDGSAWVGVGIAVPGVVDADSGFVRKAPNLGWIDLNFVELIEPALHTAFGSAPKVMVGNDANLGAIAEYVRGAGALASTVVYLSGDVGVGGGVTFDGQVMTGASGFAGEIGHMVVNPHGVACNCGNRGCWETEIGRDAILRSAGTNIAESSVAEVVRKAQSGDATSLKGLKCIADWVGIGLSNLLNVIDPDVIVLGGHLAEIYPLIEMEVESRITQSRPLFETRARISLPALTLGSTIVGASELAFTSLLNDPLTEMERSLSLVAS